MFDTLFWHSNVNHFHRRGSTKRHLSRCGLQATRTCTLSALLLRVGGKFAVIAAKDSMLQTPGDCGESGNG
jgi:hypothetical protein